MSVASCPRCGNEKHRGRCKGKVAEKAPPPVKVNGALEIPSGLGFRASLEDGQLCIEQDRPDDKGELYTHALSLAPHEARQLVDWIEQQVREAA